MNLSMVSKTPEGCECEVKELPNLVSGVVKGWALVKECNICKCIRDKSAKDSENQIKEQKINEECSSILREQAIVNLKAKGEI